VQRAQQQARAEEGAKARLRKENQFLVKTQIEENSRLKQMQKSERELEAKEIKKDFLIEHFKLERVREQKVNNLKGRGVDGSYLSEFGKMKLTQGDVRV